MTSSYNCWRRMCVPLYYKQLPMAWNIQTVKIRHPQDRGSNPSALHAAVVSLCLRRMEVEVDGWFFRLCVHSERSHERPLLTSVDRCRAKPSCRSVRAPRLPCHRHNGTKCSHGKAHLLSLNQPQVRFFCFFFEDNFYHSSLAVHLRIILPIKVCFAACRCLDSPRELLYCPLIFVWAGGWLVDGWQW